MAVIFHKLHSSGNDFIVLLEWENSNLSEKESPDFVKGICHRNYGVGGDGVFYVYNDGRVAHFDPDGSESFCVNGSLCLAFLKEKEKSIPDSFSLKGVIVNILNSSKPEIFFEVKEPVCKNLTVEGIKGVFVDIGNPHFFIEGESPDRGIALKIRHYSGFEYGVNVSFFKNKGGSTVNIATFERGVEDFTLACGSACGAFLFGFNKESIRFIPPSGIPIMVKRVFNRLYIKGDVSYVAKGSYLI